MDPEKPRANQNTLKIKTTEDEKKFRKTQYPNERSILKKMKICTVCGKSISKEIESKDIHIHPVLEVLWCKECEKFYTKDGELPVDEDGSDKFCRWCGQGGNLYCCSNCSVAFCDECILRNFSAKILKRIQSDDDWRCFVCDNKPLWSLRALCDATKRYVDSDLQSRKTGQNCCTFCDEKKREKFQSVIQEAIEERLSPITSELQAENENQDEDDMSLTFNSSLIVKSCSFSSGHLSMNTSEEDQLKDTSL